MTNDISDTFEDLSYNSRFSCSIHSVALKFLQLHLVQSVFVAAARFSVRDHCCFCIRKDRSIRYVKGACEHSLNSRKKIMTQWNLQERPEVYLSGPGLVAYVMNDPLIRIPVK